MAQPVLLQDPAELVAVLHFLMLLPQAVGVVVRVDLLLLTVAVVVVAAVLT